MARFLTAALTCLAVSTEEERDQSVPTLRMWARTIGNSWRKARDSTRASPGLKAGPPPPPPSPA